MQQTPPPQPGDGAAFEAVYARLQQDAGSEGFYERLDSVHTAQFTDGGDTLVISFEHIAALLGAGRDHQSLARRVQAQTGCAQLSLLTSDDTWFRADAVYRFFDDLVDDGFFDEFTRVVFFGAGPEGYAAAAYSVVASDAEILLVQPQATLTPMAAGWDKRFPDTRMVDFTQRYGYAPKMIDTAGRVVVLFDPAYDEDHMHAQLFDRDWVDILRTRHLGDEGGALLDHLGLLDQMLISAVAEGLSAPRIAALLRARRTTPDYLHAVMDQAEASGRPALIKQVQRFAHPHCADARFDPVANPIPPRSEHMAHTPAPSAGDHAPLAAAAPSAALAALALGGALTQREKPALSQAEATVVLGGEAEPPEPPARALADTMSEAIGAPGAMALPNEVPPQAEAPEAEPAQTDLPEAEPEPAQTESPEGDISEGEGAKAEAADLPAQAQAAPDAAVAPMDEDSTQAPQTLAADLPPPHPAPRRAPVTYPLSDGAMMQGIGIIDDPLLPDEDLPEAPPSAPAEATSDAPPVSLSEQTPTPDTGTPMGDPAPEAEALAAPKGTDISDTPVADTALSASPSPDDTETAPASDQPMDHTQDAAPASSNRRPTMLERLKSDVQRMRSHGPGSTRNRRPGKRRL